ncbi:LysE family transporter [Domibacillus sp. DTU_2020_1001157_1_SI_ALB_TIR_016]|uniref:LysE family transporter n=1 Tax=Domibacillus sp. DTU_2020_1001157_1_SI_ALB_TIR_016 TaxID=3077789 RepID=UPI0028EC57BC|nr:LysE family transporter [Domibacillus sp. DTU_2020_1001157_1_SI_ALB_TIR_016]WNS79051.1 LysE family transporter [Domibacillus sp. DTU_2020_1001157_1_SI_ALB_TIR_016]
MGNLHEYILMAVLMSMLPGTDTILVMKNTLNAGLRAGYCTVIGIATGLMFWTIIAVLGLSAAIAQSVLLFATIKYVGAAYLFYLGVRTFCSPAALSLASFTKDLALSTKDVHKKVYRQSYLQGAISNILNPKTVLVYVTFMPQFINLNGDVNQQLSILGMILVFIAVSWFLIMAHLLVHVKKLIRKPNIQKAFQKSIGAMLMVFGVKTVL